MIRTSFNFSVSGMTHEEIVEKAKKTLSDFFDCPSEELDKRVNIEFSIVEQTDSLSFDEDEYVATVIAQVKNV